MKKSLLYTSVLLFCIIAGAATGKTQVIIKIIPPELSALKDSNRCNIQMINIGNEKLRFMLVMDLKLDTNGSIYKAISNPINIHSFETMNVAWDTLAVRKMEKLDNSIQPSSTKQILPGLYNLCLEAVKVRNGKAIGKECLQINIEK